mmetsp:Transcript_2885/g.11493  ORF Transcript_2885/g.11493 Transcript_2885/m.11493 type:complete len:213 (+) Transcript_2885:918-1556(+)
MLRALLRALFLFLPGARREPGGDALHAVAPRVRGERAPRAPQRLLALGGFLCSGAHRALQKNIGFSRGFLLLSANPRSARRRASLGVNRVDGGGVDGVHQNLRRAEARRREGAGGRGRDGGRRRRDPGENQSGFAPGKRTGTGTGTGTHRASRPAGDPDAGKRPGRVPRDASRDASRVAAGHAQLKCVRASDAHAAREAVLDVFWDAGPARV